MKITIITCSLVLLFTGLGCAAFSQFVTPADIDKKAVTWVVEAGVAEANDYAGYGNMLKAGKLVDDVTTAHTVILFDLEQRIEKNDLERDIHLGTSTHNYKKAQTIEEKAFGPQGYLSMGLGLIGMGGFTGLLGLMRKRPGDLTQQDMESAVSQYKGEVTEKDKQFIEVVNGVKKFIDKNENKIPEVIDELKSFFKESQDGSTKVAVAAAKAKL